MKRIITACAALAVAAALSACQPDPHDAQNLYSRSDVGKSVKIVFGKILSKRRVQIKPDDANATSGLGAGAGLAAGGIGGSTIGNGGGSAAAAIGGAVLGAIIGNTVEKNINTHLYKDGFEYIIARDDGATVSVVQNVEKDDAPLEVGERVMVQIKGISGKGTYMRILPAGDIPAPKHPKKYKDVDDAEKTDEDTAQ